MSKQTISTLAFVALSLAATGFAQAQAVPPPPTQAYPPVQTYPQPYPQQHPQPYAPACPPRVTPPGQVIYQRFMRHFASLGLAPAQQQQIQSLVYGFAQTHPAGSPLNVPAMRQLHEQARGVLTPQQLALLEQENRSHAPAPHPCS